MTKSASGRIWEAVLWSIMNSTRKIGHFSSCHSLHIKYTSVKTAELDIHFHGHLSHFYSGFLDNHSWLDIMEKTGFFAVCTQVCVDVL